MDQKTIILPAQIGHADAVYGLMCELEGPDFDRGAFDKVYAENLEDNSIRYFLAFLSDSPVGFISLHAQRLLHHAGIVGEIQELVVAESSRGQGIGRILFDVAKKAAKALGCMQIEVCCRKERVQSHDFYQRMGMVSSHHKLCLTLMEDA